MLRTQRAIGLLACRGLATQKLVGQVGRGTLRVRPIGNPPFASPVGQPILAAAAFQAAFLAECATIRTSALTSRRLSK
jgi:hypothetical protein